jgi:enediyne polyketide synthase
MTHGIAVVGLSAWYPCGSTLREFWTSVLARRRAFRRLPERRLGREYEDPDPLAPDKTYLTRAAVIDGFSFDWVARRVPKRVFEAADLVHWLALEMAIRAIEDAGYDRATLPRERTGVIIGNTLTGELSRASGLRLRWPYVARAFREGALALGYDEGAIAEILVVTEDVFKSAFPDITEDTLPGMIPNTIAGRICNYYDLKGGGYAVDGACASSLIAITQAADALSAGRLDLALAGGIDISIDPFEAVGFAKIGALAKDEVYVYDQRSQGFLPGEGCGWALLKRLSDAERDGDYIYAVLKGWGLSSDGHGGLTAPSVEGQTLALRRAYERAGYRLADVDFVEGHGTGTAVGDATELRALAAVLAADDGCRPIGITALKSLIGHTKAAAGIGSFIKAVLAVNQRVVPPLAGCERPHPVFESDAGARLYPVLDGLKTNPEHVMRAGVSAFGFGGINVHATIESAAPPHSGLNTDIDERRLFVSAQDSEVFLFGAPVADVLRVEVERVANVAGQLSLAELTDLAAELAQQVVAGPLRAAVVAGSPDELARKLKTLLNLLRAPLSAGQVQVDALREVWLGYRPEPGRVGFVFPGQGSQQLNMARWLPERFPWAGELVAAADSAVGELRGLTLSASIMPGRHATSADQRESWKQHLEQSDVCQPAICLASVLYAQHLMRLGVRPSVVGGHSLGELTAFWSAGAFSERELFALARLRGASMAAPLRDAGRMASLRCSSEEAADLCQQVAGYVVVANLNSDHQVVVSGDRDAIEAVLVLAGQHGIAGQGLPVSNAFHSRYVAAGAERLAHEADLSASVPALSARLFRGQDGREVRSGDPLRAHFPTQMVKPVDFIRLGAALAREVDLLVEVGPGRVLSGLLANTAAAGSVVCLPVEAEPGTHKHLNRVLAAAFAHGIELDLSVLLDHRHYAGFVPPTERQFIVNPCEQDLIVPPIPDGFDHALKGGTFEAQLLERTGYDRETVRAYLEERGGFLSEVVRADIAAREVASGLPASHALAPEKVRSQHAAPSPAPAPAAVGDQPPSVNVIDILVGLVADRTGFPLETIRPHMTFLNDLNIESIAAGEIIARAAVAAGVTRLDPSALLQASIQEVAEAIAAASGETRARSAARSTHDASDLLDTLGRLTGRPSWVRAFELCASEEPLGSPAPDTLAHFRSQSIHIASEALTREQALAVAQAFGALGATTATLTYAELATRGHAPPDILIALLPRADAAGTLSSDDVRAVMQQLLAAATVARAVDSYLVYVQFGGPLSAGAFAASVHHEQSRLRVRVLDVAPDMTPPILANVIINETATEAPFVRAGYTAEGVRHIWRPVVLDCGAGAPRKLTWSREDVVLVTGGGRGLTAELALAMAGNTGARMILVGRSVAADEDPEIATTLERFRAAGAECQYVPCDVTNQQAVAQVLGHIQKELGPITAVLHGAAINRPALVGVENQTDAFDCVAAKVLGLLNVLAALGTDNPPKLLVGLSSIIGVTGMPGNAWYGFANEVLDGVLERYRRDHRGTTVVSIAYSLVDGVGMGVKLGGVATQIQRMGTSAIPVAEACKHFLRLLDRDPGTHHVVVAARLGGLDTWCPDRGSPPSMRFLEQVATAQPRIELAVRTHLSLERDPYLRDHVYRGTYLFPMVFGLEAMAQVVATVLGRSRLDYLRIEDLDLARPVIVDADEGEDILVHAEVQERDAHAETLEHRIVVGLACCRTAFSEDHFSATFVVPDEDAVEAPLHTIERPSECLAIDPVHDLYGRFLFHGPQFQRLRSFYVLRSDYCVFDADVISGPAQQYHFILGDPFFRDALLQAGQVVIAQDRGLPRSIAQLEIFPGSADLNGPLLVEGILSQRTDQLVECTITAVDAAGRVMQRLERCRFSILEHLTNEPTAEEIAAPDQRDERRTKDQLRAAAAALRVRTPALAITNLPGVQSLPAAERHAREQSVLGRAIADWQRKPPTRAAIQRTALRPDRTRLGSTGD